MMMPIVIGDTGSVPGMIGQYRGALEALADMAVEHKGSIGYITIDEKTVARDETHRRAGLHVDGIFRDGAGGWGGGGWGSTATGMLTVASVEGCRAYNQEFQGWPGDEGDCEHLRGQCGDGHTFAANTAYWVHGLCVHESLPMSRVTERQFIRLSLPSTAPWFEGYTENPLGVTPTGPVLPRRQFMN